MVEAYTMVYTGAGMSRAVLPKIRSLAGVERADIVAGEFDIVAHVVSDSPQGLLDVVTDGIQSIDGVDQTQTSIILQ